MNQAVPCLDKRVRVHVAGKCKRVAANSFVSKLQNMHGVKPENGDRNERRQGCHVRLHGVFAVSMSYSPSNNRILAHARPNAVGFRHMIAPAMSKPTIALVTATAARDVDEDLPQLESALRNAGADVTIAEWDRPHDWSRFDIALLRSTWDYPQRLAEFFDWAEAVRRKTKLLNPLSVVKWSSDKHYLRDLVRANVPTVLSKFIEPGESAPWRIAELLGEPNVDEFVVKPAIGAGSRDAQRFGPEEKDDAAEHAQRMLSEK